MSAKIELATIWVLSIITYITQNNVVFMLTVIGHTLWIIKSAPVAIKNIKDLKNYIYARMVKKTDEV